MLEQIILANKIANEKHVAKMGVMVEQDEMEVSDLKEVKGIGPATIQKLMARNVKTKAQLKELGEDELREIVGNPLTAIAILKNLD